jgi:hydroxyethylthiazole kinase-like uncharacterized protein yjeF
MKIVTAAEMRELDRKTIEDHRVPGTTLMENAGRQVMKWAETAFGPPSGRTAAVLCGKGNNGGDGLVVARLLIERGAAVRVFLLSPPEAVRGDAAIHLKRFETMGEKPEVIGAGSLDSLRGFLLQSDWVFDALFGTGLSSEISGTAARVLETVAECQKERPFRVIALDIPSGIHADTGQLMGAAVPADLTVTFGLPKRGHFLYPGAEFTGKLRVGDIGIPPELVERAEIPVRLLQDRELAARLIPRPAESHKGTFGHVLAVAGSVGKSGAAVLTGLAALRTGAGLVTLAAPKSAEASLPSRPPEIMTLPLPETKDGTLSKPALDPILGFAGGKAVLAVGPGLSTHPDTASLVLGLIERADRPMVIDADGLNAIAGETKRLKRAKAPVVLTPHPGEMARLAGLSSDAVQRDRLEVAGVFAREHGVILALKGAHTVVALPDGSRYVNPTGNPGMATAGTGDALTGMIAALIAQGYDPALAARLGVFLHGTAGYLASQAIGPIGFLAGDVITQIPRALAGMMTLERTGDEA